MRIFRPLLALGWLAAPAAGAELTLEAVNGAKFGEVFEASEGPSPLVLKAQILLDRANASPGVLDGYYGENVAKAISAFESVHELPMDGELDADVWSALGGDSAPPVLIEYPLTEEDLDHAFVEHLPEDYAEMAKMERLGYVDATEMLAERFHMDIDLFESLNHDRKIASAATIIVADIRGSPPEGKVGRVEADKGKAQVRAYDGDGKLLVAYPATIGSAENPSPSGTHEVRAIAFDPIYYYRPDINFQQGENTEPLEIPPGPNNPVGSVWIDLTEPTFGIHGTPEPSEIDKTASHGCVRLTNWDVEELAGLLEKGVKVEFLP